MATLNATLPMLDDRANDDSAETALLDQMIRDARRRIERPMQLIRRPEAGVGIARTPLGPLLVAEGPRGLVLVHFLATGASAGSIVALRAKFDPIADANVASRTGNQVRRYLAGETGALRTPADLSLATPGFQRSALERLREVPRGSVITYAALARAVGAPRAQRAVGSAMGANPVPIYVPCHRVIRSGGAVGNYGGSPELKIKLLRAEGFAISPDRRIDEHSVWGHRKTKIFCRPQCHAALRADPERMLIFADGAHARHAGLRPCKLCKPR
jgi:methylated-DNA-[protein]-cysteine S-methyltransferase